MIATVCVAQDENPISHELEGIQKKIDKADQDLEKRKKELSNDPSLDPLKGDFQSKKTAADIFYQGNNDKHPVGTQEFTDAQGQQKSLDAAANAALEALRAARLALLQNDTVMKALHAEKADQCGKFNLIIAKTKITAMLLNIGDCVKEITAIKAKDPNATIPGDVILRVKGCLDRIYDGMMQHPYDPNIDDLFRLVGAPPRGTHFFGRAQTPGGPVTTLQGPPVLDMDRLDAKRAFVRQYEAGHKNDMSHYLEDLKKWEAGYDGAHPSSGTVQPSTSTIPISIPPAKKPAYIEVPLQLPPAAPPSPTDVLSNYLRNAIQYMKHFTQPVPEKPQPQAGGVKG